VFSAFLFAGRNCSKNSLWKKPLKRAVLYPDNLQTLLNAEVDVNSAPLPHTALGPHLVKARWVKGLVSRIIPYSVSTGAVTGVCPQLSHAPNNL
jgi:hypothetical protein